MVTTEEERNTLEYQETMNLYIEKIARTMDLYIEKIARTSQKNWR